MPNPNRLERIMTVEELVCELFIRQGYLIIESSHPFEIGELHTKPSESFLGPVVIPVRVVGPGKREEFRSQCRLAFEIAGEEPSYQPNHFPVSYFYRVEALD